MKRLLLIVMVYCSVLFMSNSQETINPFNKSDFECSTIDDFISSNDVFSMDGDVVKLKIKSAVAHIVSDELQRHNLLNTEQYALDYTLVFYPVWYVNHNNKAIIGKESAMYFPNTNGCFDNIPSHSNRFYKILNGDKEIDDATVKKMEKWAKESGIYSTFDIEDTLLWYWFNEVAEFKIFVSSDIFGNKKAVLTRELPQYFIINFQDE